MDMADIPRMGLKVHYWFWFCYCVVDVHKLASIEMPHPLVNNVH